MLILLLLTLVKVNDAWRPPFLISLPFSSRYDTVHHTLLMANSAAGFSL